MNWELEGKCLACKTEKRQSNTWKINYCLRLVQPHVEWLVKVLLPANHKQIVSQTSTWLYHCNATSNPFFPIALPHI